MDADGVKGDQSAMDHNGYNWIKDVGNVHDSFDQEKEYGQNGDDDVELGGAVPAKSVHCHILICFPTRTTKPMGWDI